LFSTSRNELHSDRGKFLPKMGRSLSWAAWHNRTFVIQCSNAVYCYNIDVMSSCAQPFRLSAKTKGAVLANMKRSKRNWDCKRLIRIF